MVWNPILGIEQGAPSGGQGGNPPIQGLPGNFSYTPPTTTTTGGYNGQFGNFPGSSTTTPGSTTYTDPSGQQFRQNQQGGWQSGGRNISDLPGYLQMRGLQKGGADFSGYQQQLNNLMSDPSKIQQTPGYQFALQQGNEAINRSAAAKGMSNSGNVLAELAKYGQGMASQEYGNQVNRLSDLMKNAQQFGMGSGYFSPMSSTQLQSPWG